ncbi:chloride channel protein [Bifidobacterium dolichotidis]|uniref:Chloride channel protein n=1 Tax=Bifidobacterium dolichotidis TaxID=2306976 RepID=A0A430FSE3_9BIFI|nr:chloride channel protein [Bifidobacterium dolichotidis]RSX55804.1 chloride channel protein [Bifidobacterium dolichotidis]
MALSDGTTNHDQQDTSDLPRNAAEGPAEAGHFDNDFAEDASGKLATEQLPETTKQPFVSRKFSMVVAILVLAVVVGIAGALLAVVLMAVEHVALGYTESPELPGPFETDWRRRLISVFIGSCIAAVVWYFLRTYAKRVPSVRQALEGDEMPWWQTIVHDVLQICLCGTGMSIGREVAPRELGAMFAQKVTRVLHLHRNDVRTIVAISSGAGLAAVYNAPIAGAFYAIEILLVDVSATTVVMSFVCSAVAAWVASFIKGNHVFYVLGPMHTTFSPTILCFIIPAGIVCGICGALFRRGSYWAESHKTSGTRILFTLPAMGLATGLVAIYVPQVMGNGRATAQLGFTGGHVELWFAGLLGISFIVKATMTLLTIRFGASGGVLTPAIALGASMGCMLGILWMQVAGEDNMGAYALLGACALLSASQNAPIMAMSLVMEISQAPMNWYVPAVIICMLSVTTARWFTKHVLEPRAQRKAELLPQQILQK